MRPLSESNSIRRPNLPLLNSMRSDASHDINHARHDINQKPKLLRLGIVEIPTKKFREAIDDIMG